MQQRLSNLGENYINQIRRTNADAHQPCLTANLIKLNGFCLRIFECTHISKQPIKFENHVK
jgi:hypothetical protein